HGAHGYLIGQFLSPAANKREDIYGRDFRGRALFFVQLVRAIKERLGEDYPVICRMNGRDHARSEEHTSELQSRENLVCRLLLECSVAPLIHHPFPTRRSSDLARCARLPDRPVPFARSEQARGHLWSRFSRSSALLRPAGSSDQGTPWRRLPRHLPHEWQGSC